MTVVEISVVQVDHFCTPELRRAADDEAALTFERYLEATGDAEVLKCIMSLGDAEMFTIAIMLLMAGIDMKNMTDMEAAATRLHTMLHRGAFLAERFDGIGGDDSQAASALASIIGVSLRIVSRAEDKLWAAMSRQKL